MITDLIVIFLFDSQISMKYIFHFELSLTSFLMILTFLSTLPFSTLFSLSPYTEQQQDEVLPIPTSQQLSSSPPSNTPGSGNTLLSPGAKEKSSTVDPVLTGGGTPPPSPAITNTTQNTVLQRWVCHLKKCVLCSLWYRYLFRVVDWSKS